MEMEQKKFWEAVAEEMAKIIYDVFPTIEKLQKMLNEKLRSDIMSVIDEESFLVFYGDAVNAALEKALDNVIDNYETEAQKKFREGLNMIVSRKS